MAERTFGEALGRLIYQKRKAAGLTQVQLAEDAFHDAGKTRRVSELENGTVANPHLKTIDPIIVALKISDAELEECARFAKAKTDPDLERAYREARNLIDAIAKQFEHSNPTATLAELDDFLRAKAREWAALRARIEAIEAPENELANLKSEAARALSVGDFDLVDSLLLKAEEGYQRDRTLREVRKHSQIRITRGDNSFFRGDPKRALELYLSAAEFFRPFDENEMIDVLHVIGGQVYEYARRSLVPAFFVASKLLEVSLEVPTANSDTNRLAATHYRLGLIYRNESERLIGSDSDKSLEKALIHSRAALSFSKAEVNSFDDMCMRINLANCLLDTGHRASSKKILEEAVELLTKSRDLLPGIPHSDKLLPHISNNLGVAIGKLRRLNEASNQESDMLERELSAYTDALEASVKISSAENWGAAKLNIGNLLAEMARAPNLQEDEKHFTRMRAVAELTAAIETYPVVLFPDQFAVAQLGLAHVLFEHASEIDGELTEFYLARSMAGYEAASTVLTKDRNPYRWAEIQMYLGRGFLFHAKMEGTTTLEKDCGNGIDCLRKALQVFEDLNAADKVEKCKKALSWAEKKLAAARNPQSD